MATAIERTERESVFLRARAQQARQQLKGSLAELPNNLLHAVSPRAWTARFPWMAMAGMVLGVFSLALALQNWRERRDATMLDAAMRDAQRRDIQRQRARPGLVHRAGNRISRFARDALEQFVIRPLKIAVIAHLRGLF